MVLLLLFLTVLRQNCLKTIKNKSNSTIYYAKLSPDLHVKCPFKRIQLFKMRKRKRKKKKIKEKLTNLQFPPPLELFTWDIWEAYIGISYQIFKPGSSKNIFQMSSIYKGARSIFTPAMVKRPWLVISQIVQPETKFHRYLSLVISLDSVY